MAFALSKFIVHQKGKRLLRADALSIELALIIILWRRRQYVVKSNA